MKTEDIDLAAGLLLEARTSGRLLDSLPTGCVPTDVSGAYAIQDAVAEGLGPVGGWKVGAKGPDLEPTCAPMPASLIRAAPCSIAPPLVGRSGIEAEIAVRFKLDLPRRDTPYTRDEVVAAIGSIHPAIEIVTYRFADAAAQPPLAVAADALGNGGFVWGAGRTDPILIDQTQQAVTLTIDGTQMVERVGGNVAGDIFRLLTWLANHVAERAGGLRAGQFVTTGTCTGLIYADAGSEVSAEFPGLGSVSVTIQPA
ncbi:2-keto-4-pentenoate hydratase [Rhodocyclaceae bacterium SMB388]